MATFRNYFKMLAFAWFHGIFWALLPLFGWARFGLDLRTNTCTIDWRHNDISYKTFLFVYATVGFLLPFSINFVCYYLSNQEIRTRGIFSRSKDPISDYWHNTKRVTVVSFKLLIEA